MAHSTGVKNRPTLSPEARRKFIKHYITNQTWMGYLLAFLSAFVAMFLAFFDPLATGLAVFIILFFAFDAFESNILVREKKTTQYGITDEEIAEVRYRAD